MGKEESFIRRAFIDQMGVPEEELSDSLSYGDVAEWDSMAQMTLIAEIEDHLGVQLTTQELLQIRTVRDVRDLVTRYS